MKSVCSLVSVSECSEHEHEADWLAAASVIPESVDELRASGWHGPEDTCDVATLPEDAGAAQYRAPTLDYRLPASPHAKFVSLQRWEGTVVIVRSSEFVARLHDLTKDGVDEETSLLIEDVSSDDRELVRPGAVFYLNIGYHISLSGQRIRGMTIRFRRLPKWSADEILEARTRGQQRLSRIVSE